MKPHFSAPHLDAVMPAGPVNVPVPVPQVPTEQLVAECNGDANKFAALLDKLPGAQRDAAIAAAHKMFGNAFVNRALHAKAPDLADQTVGGNTVGASAATPVTVGRDGISETVREEAHAGGASIVETGSSHLGPDGYSTHDDVTVGVGGHKKTFSGGGSIDAPKAPQAPNLDVNQTVGGNTVGAGEVATTTVGRGGATNTYRDEAHAGGASVVDAGDRHVGLDGISGHDSVTVGVGGHKKTLSGGGSIDAPKAPNLDVNQTVGGNTVGAGEVATTTVGRGGATNTYRDEAHVGGASVVDAGDRHVGLDGISGHDSVTVGVGGHKKTFSGGGSIDAPKAPQAPNLDVNQTVGGNTVGAGEVATTTVGRGGATNTYRDEAHAGGASVVDAGDRHVGLDGISGHDSVTVGVGGHTKTVSGGGSVDAGTPQHAEQWMLDRFAAVKSNAQALATKAGTLGSAPNQHDVAQRASRVAGRIQSFGDAANAKLAQAQHSDEWATLAQLGQVMLDVIQVTTDILVQVASFGTIVPTTPIAVQLDACAAAISTTMTESSGWVAADAASAAKTAAEAAASAGSAGSNAVDTVTDAAQNGADAASQGAQSVAHHLGF